ncbi:hypothetical protein ABZ608_10075 [Streptomyces sp. NPDC013172]|uniref:hypothetical protein n=1 Tax=Streptomyces sp. NPDC013172 TaxID=3155009 RepID=UPI00340E8D30
MASVDHPNVTDWLTGVGTVGTLLFAVVTLAWDQWQRRRDRKRLQADQVSAWFISSNEDDSAVTILNTSGAPVYQVVVSPVYMKGDGHLFDGRQLNQTRRRTIGVLPPGQFRVSVDPFDNGMLRHPAVEIAFTDSSGRYWCRSGLGKLTALRKSPVTYYNLDSFGWGTVDMPESKSAIST